MVLRDAHLTRHYRSLIYWIRLGSQFLTYWVGWRHLVWSTLAWKLWKPLLVLSDFCTDGLNLFLWYMIRLWLCSRGYCGRTNRVNNVCRRDVDKLKLVEKAFFWIDLLGLGKIQSIDVLKSSLLLLLYFLIYGKQLVLIGATLVLYGGQLWCLDSFQVEKLLSGEFHTHRGLVYLVVSLAANKMGKYVCPPSVRLTH